MINQERFAETLILYKKDFTTRWKKGESFKWDAIKWFQDNWDLDAPNFGEMLDRALDHTESLLVSKNTFPRGMIVEYAKAAPEDVRSMFKDLFDETKDIYERINDFKRRVKEVHKKVRNDDKSDYQDENTITTYLWLRYPDKYYIYKYGEVKAVISVLEADVTIMKGKGENNLRNFFPFYDEINDLLKKDAELMRMLQAQLTDTCYPDPELKTVTIDFGFYISRNLKDAMPNPSPLEERRYWWLNASPKNWSFSDIGVGETRYYTLYSENGHKRRIFQNFLDARVGDAVIGYESSPIQQITTIARISAEQDGEKLYFEKVEDLQMPIAYSEFCNIPALQNMGFLKSKEGSLYRLSKDEYDVLMNLIRKQNPLKQVDAVDKYSEADFLGDVYMDKRQYRELEALVRNKCNVILQGAPGVGKTFAARRLAWAMMGEKDNSRIEFVQFHQNYAYEDFVMGYKPTDDGFKLTEGVFYKFCLKAAADPDRGYFFIIDEINRGNLSKIFGELLMMIEKDYRNVPVRLAYETDDEKMFSVPKNLYIIGMMNTADRSLALIDYALRRRFSFYKMMPGFDTNGFEGYRIAVDDDKKTFKALIDQVIALNEAIAEDGSLGEGYQIGHSYFCGQTKESCTREWMISVVKYDIVPMLEEYWFDDKDKVDTWTKRLNKIFDDYR